MVESWLLKPSAKPPAEPKPSLDYEALHAKEAISSGIYITFANSLGKPPECIRVGSRSLCFCGHLFASHTTELLKKGKIIPCKRCVCKSFHFMFRRPEEQGLWWLPNKKEFDPVSWRAVCKCKHNHELHDPNTFRCTGNVVRDPKAPRLTERCGCTSFEGEHSCLICEQPWEQHEVMVETRDERLLAGKLVDESYMPAVPIFGEEDKAEVDRKEFVKGAEEEEKELENAKIVRREKLQQYSTEDVKNIERGILDTMLKRGTAIAAKVEDASKPKPEKISPSRGLTKGRTTKYN